VGEDHSCYDFDSQENTSSRALQKKQEHHGKKKNLIS
jgi:hypothetical protein